MNQEITLAELGEAMDRPFLLAVCSDAKAKRSKAISFNPHSLEYEVKYNNSETGHLIKETTLEPHKAIKKYNGYSW